MKYIAKRELCDQDWKTQLAQGYGNIPAGAEVYCGKEFRNYYGAYVRVRYNGHVYDVRKTDIAEVVV